MNKPVGTLEGAEVIELPFAESPPASDEISAAFKAELDASATGTGKPDAALILADTLNRIEAARAQAKAEAQEDDGDRDVWRPDNDDVILRAQPATCVYWNGYNQLVVKQEAHWSEEHEPFLTFEPNLLPALIHKLTTEYESWKRDRS